MNKHKRWVIYKGIPEATKVPPQWHGWLHGNMDEPLNIEEEHSWQKKHRPNLTGTSHAHKPHDTTINAKHKAGYTAWRP